MSGHSKRISDTFLLFIIMFACVGEFLAFDIHLPNMPEMGKDLNSSKFMIQLVFILSLCESWLVQLVWGQISDAHGRRRVAIIGMSLSLLGQFCCIFATTIEMLLFFRGFQYLFVGGMWTALFGACVDWFQDEEKRAKVFSIFDLLYPVSIMFAPIIGAILGKYIGWRGNFAFLFIWQLIATILICVYLPETIVKKSKITFKLALKSYKEIVTNKEFMYLNLIICFVCAPIVVFTAHSAYLYIEYFKLSPEKFSIFQAIPMFVSFLAILWYIKLIKTLHINTAIKCGILAMALFCVTCLLLGAGVIKATAVGLIVVVSISLIGDKFVRPGMETQLYSIFKEKAASAMAVNIASYSVIIVPMTTVCAYTFDGTPTSVLWWMLMSGICTIGLYFLKLRSEKYHNKLGRAR